jgi:hypothetical protein
MLSRQSPQPALPARRGSNKIEQDVESVVALVDVRLL